MSTDSLLKKERGDAAAVGVDQPADEHAALLPDVRPLPRGKLDLARVLHARAVLGEEAGPRFRRARDHHTVRATVRQAVERVRGVATPWAAPVDGAPRTDPAANRRTRNVGRSRDVGVVQAADGECPSPIDLLGWAHRMRPVAVEPTRPFGQWILSPSRIANFATAAGTSMVRGPGANRNGWKCRVSQGQPPLENQPRRRRYSPAQEGSVLPRNIPTGLEEVA